MGTKVVVVGCGSVGSLVAELVAGSHPQAEVVLADRDGDRAAELAARLGARAETVDVQSDDSLVRVIHGADVVFNSVGPFFKQGGRVVRAAVREGASYVDICDEADVTAELFGDAELAEAAERAGITVLIGMGNTPGLSNLLAAHAMKSLDHATEINFAVGLPYVSDLTPSIVDHLLHAFDGDVPQFIEGEHQLRSAWSEPRSFDLRSPFDPDQTFGFWAHPEAITLPRASASIHQVTTRFAWLDPGARAVFETLTMLSLTDPGSRDLVARRLAERSDLTLPSTPAAGSPPPGTVTHVEVVGRRDGQPARVLLEVHSLFDPDRPRRGARLTAVPAALAVGMLLDGRIAGRGLGAPETLLEPSEVLTEAYRALDLTVQRTDLRDDLS